MKKVLVTIIGIFILTSCFNPTQYGGPYNGANEFAIQNINKYWKLVKYSNIQVNAIHNNLIIQIVGLPTSNSDLCQTYPDGSSLVIKFTPSIYMKTSSAPNILFDNSKISLVQGGVTYHLKPTSGNDIANRVDLFSIYKDYKQYPATNIFYFNIPCAAMQFSTFKIKIDGIYENNTLLPAIEFERYLSNDGKKQ